MSTPVHLIDGSLGTNKKACVTKIGQLVTAPFAYNESVYKELAVNDTAYNFYLPKVNKQFVLNGFIAKADKQVSTTTDADVVIYEATASDTTTVSKTLFQTAMVEGDLIQVMSLNLLVTEGRFINAKTTDDDIHMTILGYYIPKI